MVSQPGSSLPSSRSRHSPLVSSEGAREGAGNSRGCHGTLHHEKACRLVTEPGSFLGRAVRSRNRDCFVSLHRFGNVIAWFLAASSLVFRDDAEVRSDDSSFGLVHLDRRQPAPTLTPP